MTITAVKRRLPGKAGPQAAALAAYERARAPLMAGPRERGTGALAPYATPAPEDMFRWRVELDCGCIHELLTFGDDKAPDEHQWRDDVQFHLLPAGQLMCWHEGEPRSVPYRDILEWGERMGEWPPDPAEQPGGRDLPAVKGARVARVQRRVRWEVTLSCGHIGEVSVEDLGWTPADGSVRRHVSREELAREHARLDADLAEGTGSGAHMAEMVEHARRWWSDGCPKPGTEALCHTCDEARQIVAYERVGWLVARPTGTVQPTRAIVERRLRAAEREADRWREQLATLDAEEALPGS